MKKKKNCRFLSGMGLIPDNHLFRPAEYLHDDGTRTLVVVIADNYKIRDWFEIHSARAGYLAQIMYLDPAYVLTIVDYDRIFVRGRIQDLDSVYLDG